jgi:hypothetical protein
MDSNRDPYWPGDGVGSNMSMESWTQNGSRTYGTVNVVPGVTSGVFGSTTVYPSRWIRWLETSHEEERERVKQENKRHDVLDTGTYDEAFVGNWMRCTD